MKPDPTIVIGHLPGEAANAPLGEPRWLAQLAFDAHTFDRFTSDAHGVSAFPRDSHPLTEAAARMRGGRRGVWQEGDEEW